MAIFIKRLYRCSDVDTVAQFSDIVSHSASTNIPQLYSWEWREWDAALETLFTQLNGITKYQHFILSEGMGGTVTVNNTCDGEERTVTIQNVKSARIPKGCVL